MDDGLRQTLLSWNVCDVETTKLLVTYFEFNGIMDRDSFLYLSNKDIERILPVDTEVRRKFIDRFNREIVKRRRLDDNSLIDGGICSENEVPQNVEVQSKPIRSSTPLQSVNLNSQKSHNNSQKSDGKSVPQHEKLDLIETAYDSFQKSRPLFKLLNSSFMGKIILYYYATTKVLLRKPLSRIIIDEEFKNNFKNPVQCLTVPDEDFDRLFDNIHQLFPLEKNKNAFIERTEVFRKDGTSRKRSGGALVNAVDYYVGYCNDCGVRDIKQIIQKFESKSVIQTIDLSPLMEEKPDLTKEKVMDLCYTTRGHRFTVEYKNATFDQIVGRFRIYRGLLGKDLILMDFIYRVSLLQPTRSSDEKFEETQYQDKLVKHWPKLGRAIVDIAIAHNNLAANSRNMKILSTDIDTSCSGDYCYTNALAFVLLAELIRYNFKTKFYKDLKWEPDEQTIAKSFIRHIEFDYNQGKLNVMVDDLRSTYSALGIHSPQPFIVFCGPLKSLKATYVVIDNIYYKCDSALEAVDLCFKSFLALKLKFPPASIHIWSFLQKYVFEFKGGQTTVTSPSMTSLVDKILQIGGFDS